MDEKLQSISIKITKHTRHKGKTVEPGKVLDDLDPAYAGEFLLTGVAEIYTDEMRAADAEKKPKKGDA